MKRDNREPVVDIQMRLTMPLTTYRNVGQIMDDINVAVANAIGNFPAARFDFVGFNTHPCKAMTMDSAIGYADEDTPEEDVYDQVRRLRHEVGELRGSMLREGDEGPGGQGS
jgi:hypothetical protein